MLYVLQCRPFQLLHTIVNDLCNKHNNSENNVNSSIYETVSGVCGYDCDFSSGRVDENVNRDCLPSSD